MKSLNVVVVSHYLPPHVGGIEMVAYKQAEELVHAGHRVVSMAAKIKGIPPAPVVSEKHAIVQIRAWNFFEKMGVPFPFFAPSLLWRANRYVRRSDAVHIHDVFYMSSMVAALFATFYRKPLFITQHVGLIHHPSKVVVLVQKCVYATVGRLMYRKARRIYTYNESVTAFLVSLGVANQKIVGAMNGVDAQLFRPASATERRALRKKYKLPQDQKITLFVGRLVPKKGYKLMLDTWKDDYGKLVFAGSSVTPPDFFTNDTIINLGSMPQASLAELYRASDFFVLPSINEGFPMSVQEAMASGLPIVTTKDPGYKKYQFNEDAVQLIEPKTRHLDAALQSLVRASAEQIVARATYCREYAQKHFSWQKLVAQQVQDYAEEVTQ